MPTGQPYIELHQLDPTVQAAVLPLSSGNVGAAGTVYTSNGTTAGWQLPSSVNLYLGNNTNPSSLLDVTIAGVTNGQILMWTGSSWTNQTFGGGSVTSVSATGSTGLTVGGSPITTTGTLTFTLGAELQSLSALSTTGFVQRTGVATYSVANLTSGQITTALGFTPGTGNGTVTSVAVAGSTGLSVSGSPITTSGTVTLTLGTELQGLSGLAATGLVARTGAGTYTPRTISQTGTDFTITNGSGAAGNPTIDLTNVVAAGTYTQVTVSATGRVTAGGNPGYITGNQTITLSGDVTGSGTTAITTALAASGVTAGSGYNNFTVDAKGRVTSASTFAYLTTAVGSVTAGTGISVTGTSTAPVVNNTGVTSFSAGTTGLTPNTATTGAVTLAGTLGIANGGTGQVTANDALNALLPAQTGNAGSFLQTDGTNATWQLAGGGGTVTNVSTVTTGMGLTMVVTNPSSTPQITLAGTLSTAHGGTGLTTFTANGVFYASSTSAVTQAINATGTNKFLSQVSSGVPTFNTIAFTDVPAFTASGDATGTYVPGSGNIPLTLASVVTAGSVGSTTLIPVITYDAKGRITSTTTAANPQGTVTSVSITAGTGISQSGSPITSSGAITITNTGVTSLTGTANQVAVSASTGAVTLSMPNNVIIPTPSSGVALTVNGNSGGTGITAAIQSTFSAAAASPLLSLKSTASGGFATLSISGNGTVGTNDLSLFQNGTTLDASVLNRANANLVLGTNGSTIMTISSTGITQNVGALTFTASGGSLGAAPTTYGSMAVGGSNGTYAGFQFTATTNNRTFMVSTSGTVSGVYAVGTSAWDWYFSSGVLTAGTVPASQITAGTLGAGTYTLSGTFNATVLNATSDRNLKTNIRNIVNPLEIVQGLNGVRFDWMSDGTPSAGLIAQDVEEVMPELVTTREDGTKAMNYNGIVGALVESVKELSAMVASLKAELDILKAK